MGFFIRWMFSLIAVSALCANATYFGFQGQHKPHAPQPGVVLQRMSWPDPKLEPDQGRPPTTPQPALNTLRQPVFAVVKPQIPPGHPGYKPWRVPTNTHMHLGHAKKPSQLPASPYWVQVPSFYLNVHKEKPQVWEPTASPATKMPNYPVRHVQHATRYPMQHPTQLPRYTPNVFQVVPKQQVPDMSHYTPAQGGQQKPQHPWPPKKLDVQGYPPKVKPQVPNVPRYPIHLPRKFQYQEVKGPKVPHLPQGQYEQMSDYSTLSRLVPHPYVLGLPGYYIHPPRHHSHHPSSHLPLHHPSRRYNYSVKGPPVLQQLQEPRFEWSPEEGQWVPKFSPRQ